MRKRHADMVNPAGVCKHFIPPSSHIITLKPFYTRVPILFPVNHLGAINRDLPPDPYYEIRKNIFQYLKSKQLYLILHFFLQNKLTFRNKKCQKNCH